MQQADRSGRADRLYCILARGRALPAVVEGFNAFLKSYIAGWVNSRNGALIA